MKFKKIHWMGIVSAAIVIGLDFAFFYDNQSMLFFLMGIGVGIGVLPFIVGLVLENKRQEGVNEMFLEFSRNLAESVGTGTPVSKSIVNMRKKNYGVLNPYVQKLANQIELGIPVDRALQVFANDVDNVVIKRAVALIREAERAGGEIDYILDSTARSIAEVDKLKKERRAAIYNLVMQGYIIFFIFIGITLVMEFKIIPLTEGVGNIGLLTSRDFRSFDAGLEEGNGESIDTQEFTTPFLFLLLTQGLFAGLTIGKLTEGSIKQGVKHSFVLMIASFLISTGARLFVPTG